MSNSNGSDKRNVYFRVDANSTIGLGHLSRCLAIAESLKNCTITFFLKNTSPQFINLINKNAYKIIAINGTINDDNEINFILRFVLGNKKILVLDGYHFSSDYQKKLMMKGTFLVVIDDLHQGIYHANCIINHAPFFDSSKYTVSKPTDICTGLEYAMVRKCFLENLHNHRQYTKIENICVCFGATNQSTLIQSILKLLIQFEHIREIHVIQASAHTKDHFVSELGPPIKYHWGLCSKEICEIMQRCELMICPSSTIALEALLMKMILITGITAENQLDIHAGITKYDTVKSVNDFRKLNEKKLFNLLKNVFNTSHNGIEPLISTHKMAALFEGYLEDL